MAEQQARLEWDAGGWFGSQLGGTAWILVAAAICFFRDISTGLLLLLFFVAPNLLGLVLWQRKKLSCYVSIQLLFASCGLSGLFAIYVLEQSGLWLEIQTGGAVSSAGGYFLLTSVVLILMVYFHLRFGRRPDQPSK